MPDDEFIIYCDKADDEELAQLVFTEGPLARAHIRRLPQGQGNAPAGLEDFLRWERSDWLVVRNGVLVAAAEISRHGYTGDNGFQRFARLARASALGVPGIYFTPFARTRLNERDAGLLRPRNVAPEMFQGLLDLSDTGPVPALAVRWPTDDDGDPHYLGTPQTADARADLLLLITGFATARNRRDWSWVPRRFRQAMEAQAALPYRVSEVRFQVDLPISSINDRAWLDGLLRADYVERGKADKLLARLALDGVEQRPFSAAPPAVPFWTRAGQAQVLYLGYQWRPDPACGLIAYSSVRARAAGLPLIVVWPRVFLENGDERQFALGALRQFAEDGDGPLLDLADELELPEDKVRAFRNRVSIAPEQFGVYSRNSKIARILSDCAELVVFGDKLFLPT